jgi:hypothetical protein
MELTDLQSRVRRLERFSMGLMKEIAVVEKANDPMLRLERQAYLQELRDGLSGVEAARVVKDLDRSEPAG